MATQTEPAFFVNARNEGKTVVTETPKFDLDSYIANYQGKLRIVRLFHIGKTSTILYSEALQLAAAEAKQGKDTELYEKVVNLWSQLEPNNPDAKKDDTWVIKTNRENLAESARLEAELKGYKNNLIKESIRMGYDDTGRHYQDIGELSEAVRAFTKERECAQTAVHLVIMQQRLIGVHLEQQNWLSVESSVHKVQNIGATNQAVVKTQDEEFYSVLMGLAQMSTRNYEGASDAFLSCTNSMLQAKPDHTQDEYVRTLTPSDIATYGALCSLASLDRSQLQSRVLDNHNFRSFLEMEPHLRRAITAFISGKFATCLSILEGYRTDYLLDLYLAPHFSRLFDRIRSKALVQYFVPFSCVTFKSLAEAFNTTEDVIENSLVDLIKSKTLPGRLDLENNLLIANKVDSRNVVHADALRTAKAYEKTAHQKVLRTELLNAKLEVAPNKDDQGFGPDVLMGLEQHSTFGGQLGHAMSSAKNRFFASSQG